MRESYESSGRGANDPRSSARKADDDVPLIYISDQAMQEFKVMPTATYAVD